LGYATFPNANNTPTSDGIVIRHDRMGAIGTSSTGGRTLTHEVGHCLNLFHTFQGGCFGAGDGCADTPPAAEANFGCATSVNSCSNSSLPDQVENYMDYSNDDCMNMFTICQRQRATAVLNNNALRGSLVTPQNLVATGVEQSFVACPPTADFTFREKSVCAGTAITFTNRSAIQDGDTYWWIFPGGTPSSSTDTNPTVFYDTPGHYPVYLDVNRNNQRMDRKGMEKAIAVRVNYPEITGIFSEGFETTEIPFPWHTINEQGDWAFEVTTQAAYSGSRSATLNNFDIRTTGLSTSLITPQIDMRWTSNLVIRWKHAFARTNNANSDQLRIAVSTDCGATWQIRAVRSSFILASMPTPISASWFPSQQSHWKEDFIDLSSFANSEDPILVRFEFVNGGGNNFFIDNIQLDATVSAETFARDERFVSVFPNPNNGAFQIVFDLPEATAVTAILMDVTGRQIAIQDPGVLPAGKSDIRFDAAQQLSPGMYLIKIQTTAFGEIIRKITVE
jgi:PKD repeat protein